MSNGFIAVKSCWRDGECRKRKVVQSGFALMKSEDGMMGMLQSRLKR